ncbi:hypothetical protein [Cellulophaga sp. Hel_I_12]|uniref:DUF7832 domain-containing protein n=1 Tax=Cellulophaga sp. Hel_I_12 TaxID=1249972 RepID=UPI000690CB9F|nr:hypothetical protein [Cellulophaga sp. Hel_I_12]
MRIRLEKKNRVTTDFVEIVIDKEIMNVRQGKVKKTGGPSWGKHCGTKENAILEANKIKQEFIEKKYIEVRSKQRPNDFNGVFDKAKWHFRGEFPDELDIFQGYVHTGFYLTWIIEKGLYDTNGDKFLNSEIEKVRKRETTGAEFFERNLDGVLMDDDLMELGNEFTYNYYEKGKFLKDYSEILLADLPTLYHVQDNWANYEKLLPVFEKRFKKWKKSKKPKWWKFN